MLKPYSNFQVDLEVKTGLSNLNYLFIYLYHCKDFGVAYIQLRLITWKGKQLIDSLKIFKKLIPVPQNDDKTKISLSIEWTKF